MSHKGHPFPASQAWMLDNWLRRLLQPPSQLIRKLAISPEDTFVDFGCGPGYYLPEIAKRAKTVIAADISSEMLAKARNKVAKAKANNVQFLKTDGKTVGVPDASVNKIMLVTVYHEIGENEKVLQEFQRILKPDGKLLIVEIIRKSRIAAGPVQNPTTLQAEIESGGFHLEQMMPYKMFGIFFFTKTRNQ